MSIKGILEVIPSDLSLVVVMDKVELRVEVLKATKNQICISAVAKPT